ncbi:RNA polymerase sigma factor [Dactylosporangium matsuzakiense]|uniref:RNA polymerase sigma factor n=1 Tax=Dactylosporangium matsuzakiense TaxID=53360 RepID=A0A9W6NTH3_9ACTN|nr:sigma-70 family RNA polymerase sigma factor [Dactylosporangium matsuzakiense]UWZ44570.1 sigma-70 family RNA polymerase sigma factor [Dactylosporangium matsuzakiense]GLL08578.1 RNA polymerase sigma factor [Dactylosporangium matsuzakiense]
MEAGGDESLVRLIAAGDAGALGRLYSRYERGLFGYLHRLAGDRMVAEEILQDTMLAVWRSAGTFAGRAKVSTWLFGIARRQAHNRLRGRGAPAPSGIELAERPDGGAGPEELAIAAAGGTPVAAAIDRLPAHHRDVIALVFVAGLPLADVAEVLGIPVGTVKSRLYHARSAVAAALNAQEVPR